MKYNKYLIVTFFILNIFLFISCNKKEPWMDSYRLYQQQIIETYDSNVNKEDINYEYDFINDRFWKQATHNDINGNILTNYLYKQVREYSQGLACILIGDKWGFIDNQGNFAFSNNFTFAESFANDGLAWGSRSDKKKAGFIGKNGEFKILIPSDAKKVFDLRLNKQLFY